METLRAISADGKQIAYDRTGQGPALILLHGGGSSRQEWHDAGYVARLAGRFTVITIDLRGHGQSSLPTKPAAYAPARMSRDILAVADACGVERFAMWGMSYGGKVGRYLAIESKRVSRFVLMGTPMGPGVTGQRRQEAIDFCAHWSPIMQSQHDGALALASLSPRDQKFLHHHDVPVMLAWVRSMLDWPAVEPADFPCPALWLIGSQDPHAMASLKEYEANLKRSKVRVEVLDDLDHEQVFSEVGGVLDIMVAFTEEG